jgi:hypothetical protein
MATLLRHQVQPDPPSSENSVDAAMYTTLLIVLAGMTLPLIVGWLVVRIRARHHGQVVHFRCPGRRERLRYVAKKGRRQAMCPNCLAPATLPMSH